LKVVPLRVPADGAEAGGEGRTDHLDHQQLSPAPLVLVKGVVDGVPAICCWLALIAAARSAKVFPPTVS
jgi:hypothetical protein